MIFIVRSGRVVDEISEPGALADRIPRWSDRFDALREIRSEARLGGRPPGKEFRRVASIPEALLGRLQEIDEDFLADPKVFWGWLRKHPEYSVRDLD